MDRNKLKTLLENYRTPFEEEKSSLSEFIQLTEDSSCFLRERKEGHFTASAWIVLPRPFSGEAQAQSRQSHPRPGKW